MEKEKNVRKSTQIISRMTTLAVLSALGFVLMAYARITYFIPWLQVEFSDVVVMIAYAMYGWWGGIVVAVIKTGADLLVNGVSGPADIGHITALLASLTYVLGLFLTSHVFKLFKRGFWFRLIGYIFIMALVSLLMTGLNVLFITPVYMTGRWATCFDSDAVAAVEGMFKNYGTNYFTMVNTVYLPFNLLKSVSIVAIYEIVCNRVIFILMARSPKMKKYFLGPKFEKEEKEVKKETDEMTTAQAEDILLGSDDKNQKEDKKASDADNQSRTVNKKA